MKNHENHRKTAGKKKLSGQRTAFLIYFEKRISELL